VLTYTLPYVYVYELAKHIESTVQIEVLLIAVSDTMLTSVIKIASSAFQWKPWRGHFYRRIVCRDGENLLNNRKTFCHGN